MKKKKLQAICLRVQNASLRKNSSIYFTYTKQNNITLSFHVDDEKGCLENEKRISIQEVTIKMARKHCNFLIEFNFVSWRRQGKYHRFFFYYKGLEFGKANISEQISFHGEIFRLKLTHA